MAYETLYFTFFRLEKHPDKNKFDFLLQEKQTQTMSDPDQDNQFSSLD